MNQDVFEFIRTIDKWRANKEVLVGESFLENFDNMDGREHYGTYRFRVITGLRDRFILRGGYATDVINKAISIEQFYKFDALMDEMGYYYVVIPKEKFAKAKVETIDTVFETYGKDGRERFFISLGDTLVNVKIEES